jgi:MftR C-terminal domain
VPPWPAANPSLQERQLTKLASLSAAIASALRSRGVADPAAMVTAEAGVAVFKIAFERWIEQSNDRDLSDLMQDTMAELKAATGR